MTRTNEPITVVVTGVGGGGHGEQVLKALRLSTLPLRIVGTDMSPISAGLQHVDAAYLLPPATDRGYLPALLRVAREERAQVLIHGSEPELKCHSRHQDQLRAAGLFLPINPPQVIDLCMDKVKTCQFLDEHGFGAPKFRQVRSLPDALEFTHLPAILKPSVGGGGSANVFLAQSRQEVEVYASHLLKLADEFIIQEYVGTADHEYTVGVLTDMNGELINSIAIRRNILSTLSNRIKVPNRTGNARYGSLLAVSSGVSQGEIGRFPQVTQTCERIAQQLGAKGPLNIQCRLVDGAVKVLEINPRFSGTTSLRAMAGYNEPEVLIRRHLLGEPIEKHFPYREGFVMRGLSETFVEQANFIRAEDLAA